MNYYGTAAMDDGVLDYYNGTVKIYWMDALGVDFWYYEDEDGKPLEQGEGCERRGRAVGGPRGA